MTEGKKSNANDRSGLKPNSHCRTGCVTGRAQCKMECGSFVPKLLRISKGMGVPEPKALCTGYRPRTWPRLIAHNLGKIIGPPQRPDSHFCEGIAVHIPVRPWMCSAGGQGAHVPIWWAKGRREKRGWEVGECEWRPRLHPQVER